jgi:hypothetical protein
MKNRRPSLGGALFLPNEKSYSSEDEDIAVIFWLVSFCRSARMMANGKKHERAK